MITYRRNPGKYVDTATLKRAFQLNGGITKRCHDIEFYEDTDYLKVMFTEALPAPDEVVMDAIITAHSADANPRKVVSDTDYTILPFEAVLGVTGLTANRTFTMPLADQCDPLVIYSIADEDGSCRGNRKMMLDTQGSDTIEGITQANQADQVIFSRTDGVSKWFTHKL